MNRSPIKQKRDKPRRNEGRIKHKRMKRPIADKPTAEEKFHMGRLTKLPCVVPGCFGSSVFHHIKHMKEKRCNRDHRFGANLCPDHHNMGDFSIHLLGGERAFLNHHGVDLVRYAIEQWDISQRLWEKQNG